MARKTLIATAADRAPAGSTVELQVGIVVSAQPGTNRIRVRLASASQRSIRNVTCGDVALQASDRVLIARAPRESTWFAVTKIQTTNEYGTVASEALSEDEYEAIWNIGDTLERLVTAPAEMAQMTTDADTKMPVVVDVHTDPNSGLVLEEGTGYPMRLYVVVEIEGELYVTVGASFSYHEFTQPMSNRLTDEAWQDMLDSGQYPAVPSWTASFT